MAFVSVARERPGTPVFVGIDPSRSRTAVVVLRDGKVSFSAWYGTKSKSVDTDQPAGVFLRGLHNWLRKLLLDVVVPYQPSAVLIAVEGYSHGAKFASHRLGEVGGIVRLAVTDWAAHRSRFPVYAAEISPLGVKSSLTGNHLASKGDMVTAALSRGFKAETEDEADAFGLADFMADFYRLQLGNSTARPHTVKYFNQTGLDKGRIA